jgi:uncharacterized membrane-anchored protein YjiN (DUF445 family)
MFFVRGCIGPKPVGGAFPPDAPIGPADPAVRHQINRAVVNIASDIVAEHKVGISSFIADQVNAWDTGQLVNLIENNVGKDLQYIRFNGALIGGLAGLLLYSAEALLLRTAEALLRLA